MNNKVIATNRTNPILMKIARREKWVKPFAKKLTVEDATHVKELHLAKLFMLFVPSTGDEEVLIDSGDGNYCVPIEIHFDNINIFNSDVIVDADGNQYCFADFLEHKQSYTFEIWNVLPDAHLESFTEFKYFTSVTEIPPFAFYRFKKLKKICLPPSIKTIGNKAFYGCTSLVTIESDALIEKVMRIKI